MRIGTCHGDRSAGYPEGTEARRRQGTGIHSDVQRAESDRVVSGRDRRRDVGGGGGVVSHRSPDVAVDAEIDEFGWIRSAVLIDREAEDRPCCTGDGGRRELKGSGGRNLRLEGEDIDDRASIYR